MPITKRLKRTGSGFGPSPALATRNELRGPTATTAALPFDDDDQVLQNAAFGLAHVPDKKPKRLQNWSRKLLSGKVAPTPKRRTCSSSKKATSGSGHPREQWLQRLQFADAVATMLVVPLRFGFFFDPFNSPRTRHVWTAALTVFTFFDLLSALMLFTPMIFRRISSTLSSTSSRRGSNDGKTGVSDVTTFRMTSRMPSKIVPEGHSTKRGLIVEDGDETEDRGGSAYSQSRSLRVGKKRVSKASRQYALMCLLVRGLMLGQWELLLCAAGEYNLSHIGGLFRLAMALYLLPDLFSKAILKQFRTSTIVRNLAFSTVALVFHGTWIGLYLCHLSAAGYMFIAHYECGIDFGACPQTPLPGCWVLKDGLERGSQWRQYVRTMYWASKTVTTLGQGDLVPATMMETNYCIIVQFISGLWATCFLSTTGFVFSRRDAKMQESTATRFEQSRQFVLARQLSKTTMDDVTSYFRYMQRTRNGVDEASVLVGLPNRYRAQCSHQIKQNYVKRIPFFRNQQGAFLRAILDALQEDFFSPDQVIVEFDSTEELLIVQAGEVRVSTTENIVVRRLLSGNFYADYALMRASKSAHRLVAESPSEIWWLPRRVFEETVMTYFPAGKSAVLLGRRVPNFGEVGRPSSSTDVKDLALRKFMDKVDRDTAKSVQSVATWRFPSSRFRSRWRKLQCACLLFIAIEVPVHVAFHRSFSAFSPNRGESPANHALQYVGVCVGLLVEAFCYSNWYLQAYVFVRRSSDGEDGGDGGAKSDSQLHAHDLIIERKQIFRHYLENDDLLSDCLANLPISIVWDLLPKSNLASHTVMWMRFFRLLRLLRLRQLPHDMRVVMTERNLSPPTQLLVFNTTACIVLANLAASIFYLVADFTHVSSGMASFADVLGHMPVSSSLCLSDSSISGNCTWFMYDYSQFGIDLSYLRSMHWSLVLLSTVGYGDILSFSDAECFVGFWWIFAGAVICYFTASATSSVISHWRVLRVAKSEKLEEINRTLMSLRSLSPATITVIQRYYLTTWRMNGSAVTEDEVLGHLPKSVRSRISRELYASVSKCRLFVQAKCSDSLFIHELVVNARSEIFLAGDVITGKGHTAEESFVIQNGAVEIFVQAHKNAKSSKAPSSRVSQFKSLQWSSFALLRNAMVETTTRKEDGWLSLSVAVLRKSDMFGEESLSYPDRSVYAVSARALTSTQVVVISRQSVLELIDRFPDEVTGITATVGAKMEKDRSVLEVIQHNIETHMKIARLCGYLGLTRADVEDTRVTENYVIHPDSVFARIWSAIVSLILLYNFYQINFRLAFLSQPLKSTMEVLNAVDYAGDALLVVDIYLKWNHFGYTDAVSGKVLDRTLIRRRYQDGWLKWDMLSTLPVYFPRDAFKMALGRLPRLLHIPQLLETLRAFEEKLQKRFLTGGAILLSVFDMVKFLLFFLSAAHHIGSLYYLLGRLQLEYGVVEASWISADAVLSAYPDRPEVHYIRSMYWCLETFTVVCFGDVIARNPAETIFASATCILGWIFIGQIIGRMTSLVLNMDKEAHAHAERVNDFEEYAKRRCLPPAVRERAKECAEYKSKTLLELNAHEILSELPRQLRTTVFDEAYGKILRVIPEFDVMTAAQIQAVASALVLEIYMRQDIIFTEGSVTTRLFIMKEGRGELFSESSAMVFASIHEGVVFGDTAFFIPGLKNFASARACTSCQVLQLERRRWKALWPESVRRGVEEALIPLMREKHRVATSSFLNIVKNFEMSKNTVIQRPVNLHRRRTLRVLMMAEKGKLERQLLVDCFLGTRPKSKSQSRWIAPSIKSAITRIPRRVSAFVKRNTHSEDTGSQGNLSSAMIARTRLRNAITKVQSARPDKETMWSRHARKLHILRMLDNKKNQAEAELEDPRAVGVFDDSNGGNTRTRFGHFKFQLARRKSTGDQLPMLSMRTDEASVYSTRSQKFSGNSTHSSRDENEPPIAFRRHSIQMNNSDILTKFIEMRDPREKIDDTKPDRQSEDESSHRLSGGLFALDKRFLKKGKSSASLVTPVVPIRQRSNSLHELLVNGARAKVRRRVSFYARALGDVITSAFKSQQSATHLYGIWCEPPLPPSFVLEGSGFRRAWDTAMLAICLYCVLVIPFRASFTYEYLTESGSKGSIEAWFVVEYVMDAFCVADFMLRKNYFSFVHRGEIVTDTRQIRDHYFHEGTYVIDMVSLLPLEVLAPVHSFFRSSYRVTWYHIAVLRLIKILRITHLHDLSERLQQMLVYDFKLKIVRPSLVYWVRITLDFVLGAHWVACIMYAVAFNYVADDGHTSWLKQPGMLTFVGCEDVACVGSTSVATRYSRSYHFSMGAITTVSYGDIAPLNAPETFATTLVIVMSIVLFGMLSGGFFQLLEMEFGRRADYEQRVAHVAQYMQFHRFHPRMWKQMQLYFAVHWTESKGMNEDKLLRGLTTSVKKDLSFFVMKDFVKNMRLLASAEPAFARAMITAFQQELFVRNDTIISEGDTDRSLYVIESGLVSVRLTKKSTLEQIEVIKGRYEFIGEKSLIFGIPRTATCIALCACSVLILTLDKYEAILEEFPECREKNVRDWMFTKSGSRAVAPMARKPVIKR